MQELVVASNQLFQNLKSKGKISDKQLKYFTYEYKKVSGLEKLYLLPKTHKRLHNVPGRPMISNCEPLQRELLKFLSITSKPLCNEENLAKKTHVILQTKLKTYETFLRMNFGYSECSWSLFQYSAPGWFKHSFREFV